MSTCECLVCVCLVCALGVCVCVCVFGDRVPIQPIQRSALKSTRRKPYRIQVEPRIGEDAIIFSPCLVRLESLIIFFSVPRI